MTLATLARPLDREKIGRLFLLALNSGSSAAVRAFLSRDMNLDARDSAGRTPLMIAASRGHFECSRYLLEAGSDPSAIDDEGLSASDHARRAACPELLELLEAFAPRPSQLVAEVAPTEAPAELSPPQAEGAALEPEAEDQATVTVQEAPAGAAPLVAQIEASVGIATPQEADEAELDWIEDEAPLTPEQDVVVLARVEALQEGLSRFHGEADGESWADVAVSLPARMKAETWRLPQGVRRRVVDAISSTLDIGAFVRPDPGSHASGLKPAGIDLLFRVAEDAGLRTFEPDPWWELLARGTARLSQDSGELLEEFEHRLDTRRSRPSFDAEVARIPPLDRSQEEALWSAIEQAIDAAFMEVSKSAEALSCILETDRLVRAGQLPFSFVSNLDLPNDESAEEEFGGEDVLDGADEPACTGPTVPKTYADGMAFIEAVCSDGMAETLSISSRKCVNALRQCSVTIEFVEWVGGKLAGAGSSETAAAIGRCSTRVKRVRAQIAHHHMPHVIRAAERYSGRGLERDDLVQEGSIGLLRAVVLYDRSRGHRFWTYAIWWVRQAMSRALQDRVRLIRLPVHVGEKLVKIERAAQLSQQEKGRAATYDELSEEVGVPSAVVGRLLRAAQPLEELEAATARESWNSPWELDVSGDADPFEAAATADARSLVSRTLMTLDPREERILRLRFGFGLSSELTLEEVGQQFGVTRERIRQIEAKALRRLGHVTRSRALRSLADD